MFNQLAEFNNENVIFATNTSSISVSSIQEKVIHPHRVVGMHFFNPAYIMKLVEVVKGTQTEDLVANKVFEICKQMGKQPVMCKDAPGFIVNRVARHYYLEALKIASEDIAVCLFVTCIIARKREMKNQVLLYHLKFYQVLCPL